MVRSDVRSPPYVAASDPGAKEPALHQSTPPWLVEQAGPRFDGSIRRVTGPSRLPTQWDSDIDKAIASMHRGPSGVSVRTAIANAIVRIHHEHIDSEPTRARTTIDGDTIIVVLSDVYTHEERSLIAAGHDDQVLSLRRALQAVMRDEIAVAVESATGRRVAALMSSNHIGPDLAVEVCVLAPREEKKLSATRARLVASA